MTATIATRTWGNYEVEEKWMVGQVGNARTGQKTHLLRATRIVRVIDEEAEKGRQTLGSQFLREQGKSYGEPRPVYLSAYGACNSNGQHVGRPFEGVGLDKIDCQKCRKRAEQSGLIGEGV